MTHFNPTSTEEMVFSNAETKELLVDILQQHISFPSNGKNSLLFYGTFGSGKTTYADIFFNEYERSFNGNNPHIEHIIVDGNQKITTTTERLTSIANLISFNESGKHYFVFDEIDGYSKEQQQRLKHWLNHKHIVCVMTTNYINRIDKGLRSRCYEVEFNASSNVYDYTQRMKQIIQQNNLPMLTDEQLLKIAQKGNGDWRQICATLQRVYSKTNAPPPTKPKLTLVS